MKYEQHEGRRSFAKWALPGQRVVTLDSTELYRRREKAMAQGRTSHLPNIGKNNGPVRSQPGVNISTQFQLHKHSCLSDPAGNTAQVIFSYEYRPQPKAPSRRDRRREQVREAREKGVTRMALIGANS